MKRSFEDYLNDIMEAITAIEAFTMGMTKEKLGSILAASGSYRLWVGMIGSLGRFFYHRRFGADSAAIQEKVPQLTDMDAPDRVLDRLFAGKIKRQTWWCPCARTLIQKVSGSIIRT